MKMLESSEIDIMWVKCAKMLNLNFVTFELNEKRLKKM